MTRLGFWDKVKGFLAAPASTFDNVEPESLGSALKYFAIWAPIFAVLFTILFYTVDRGIFETLGNWVGVDFAAVSLPNPIVLGLLALAGSFAGLFISGSWAHLFVRAFGGRRGYANTIKAFAYGITPSFLFGWIPLVGMFTGIWALVLYIIGVRQLHGISTGRAVAAVLLSALALGVIVAVIEVVVTILFVITLLG
jgi:hypothetical protein